MHKSNTNSEKIFDNNDEDIKTVEKLPQVKLSDSSIILHNSTISNSSISKTKDFFKKKDEYPSLIISEIIDAEIRGYINV